MFAILFRLYPILTMQVLLLATAIFILISQKTSECYGLTALECSMVIFQIQFIFVLKMLKKNRVLRKKYLCPMLGWSNFHFYIIILWNMLNLLIPAILMIVWNMLDLIAVCKDYSNIANADSSSDQNNIYQSNTGHNLVLGANPSFKMCLLCLFQSLIPDTEQSENQYRFIIKVFLVCFSLIIGSILSFISLKLNYQSSSKLLYNRRISFLGVQYHQSLLDCRFLTINQKMNTKIYENSTVTNCSFSQSNMINQDFSICSICLETCRQNKIIQLKCGHIFHYQCIVQWLSENDLCPFRCDK